MAFSRLAPEDFVVSSDAITATMWSNGSPTLTSFFTSSTQAAGSSGNFYLNVYQTASTDAAAAIQFAIAYGNNDGSGSVYCPTKIIKTTSQKVLADARGYVIADYQDYLEKKWIADMEAKYPVKINEAVLKVMVKK